MSITHNVAFYTMKTIGCKLSASILMGAPLPLCSTHAQEAGSTPKVADQKTERSSPPISFPAKSDAEKNSSSAHDAWIKGRAAAIAKGETVRGTVNGKLLHVDWVTGDAVGLYYRLTAGDEAYLSRSQLVPHCLEKLRVDSVSDADTFVAFEKRMVAAGSRSYMDSVRSDIRTELAGHALELRAVFIDIKRPDRSFLTPWIRGPKPTFPDSLSISYGPNLDDPSRNKGPEEPCGAFPETEFAKMFEKFVRSSSNARSSTGNPSQGGAADHAPLRTTRQKR
jgi:hypothetical protein